MSMESGNNSIEVVDLTESVETPEQFQERLGKIKSPSDLIGFLNAQEAIELGGETIDCKEQAESIGLLNQGIEGVTEEQVLLFKNDPELFDKFVQEFNITKALGIRECAVRVILDTAETKLIFEEPWDYKVEK